MRHLLHRSIPFIPVQKAPSGVGLTESQSLATGGVVLAVGAVVATLAWRAGQMPFAVIVGLGTLFGAPLVASKTYSEA